MATLSIASKNPVKIQAALGGFKRMFPEIAFSAEPVSVPSGVSDQPRSSAETLQGAINRVERARQTQPDANYWVGIEGGIEDHHDGMTAFAWVVVWDGQRLGKGCTGTFYLPESVAQLVRAGKELGEADDIVFARKNSKQENGAIGILTGDVIDRAGLYEPAVILALLPFKNPDLYP